MRTILGNPEVLTNLFRARRLQQEGSATSPYRILLVGSDGVLLGVRIGGYCVALERHGLANAFVATASSSTSVPMFNYFLAGQSVIGRSIYEEECTTRNFFDKRRKPMMDVRWLGEVFAGTAGAEKALDVPAFMSAKPCAYAALRDMRNDDLSIFDLRDVPSVIDAMCAAIAIERWSCGSVPVRGAPFGDVASKDPLPLHTFTRMFRPTDMLILMSYPQPERGDRKYAPRLFDELDWALSQRDVRISIVYPPESEQTVTPFTQDTAKLRRAGEEAERHLDLLLQEAERSA